MEVSAVARDSGVRHDSCYVEPTSPPSLQLYRGHRKRMGPAIDKILNRRRNRNFLCAGVAYKSVGYKLSAIRKAHHWLRSPSHNSNTGDLSFSSDQIPVAAFFVSYITKIHWCGKTSLGIFYSGRDKKRAQRSLVLYSQASFMR